MKLIVEKNHIVKVERDLPKEVLKEIDKATSYFLPAARFSKLYKSGKWNGIVHLFSKRTFTFPLGLLDIVLEKIKSKFNLRVEIVNTQPFPKPLVKDFDLEGISLRDYQLEAAEAMVYSKQGILKAATNSGKTEIAAAVIKYIGRPALFIVPGKDLLYQTSDRLRERLGIDIGEIGDGVWNPDLITVAIINSLARVIKDTKHENYKSLKEILKETKVLIVDECHKMGANTFYEVINACDAPFRFAMSGTPLDRTDGADLAIIAQSGPIIYEISNAELIKKDVSIPVEVHFYTINEPKIQIDEADKNYSQIYKEGIIENTGRNLLIYKKIKEFYNQGLTTLVIVDKINHGKILNGLFWSAEKDEFIPSEFVYGEDSSLKRKEVIREVRDGTLKVLISTSIFDLGIDIPSIDAIVMAAGGKSKIRTLQRVGRGLRKGSLLNKLLVIDFIDKTHYYLRNHSMKRKKDYVNEGCFKVIEQ